MASGIGRLGDLGGYVDATPAAVSSLIMSFRGTADLGYSATIYATGGDVHLQITRDDTAQEAQSILDDVVLFAGESIAQRSRMRAHIWGDPTAVQMRARAWKASTTEPGAWQVSGSDAYPSIVRSDTASVVAGGLGTIHESDIGRLGQPGSVTAGASKAAAIDASGGRFASSSGISLTSAASGASSSSSHAGTSSGGGASGDA